MTSLNVATSTHISGLIVRKRLINTNHLFESENQLFVLPERLLYEVVGEEEAEVEDEVEANLQALVLHEEILSLQKLSIEITQLN